MDSLTGAEAGETGRTSVDLYSGPSPGMVERGCRVGMVVSERYR